MRSCWRIILSERRLRFGVIQKRKKERAESEFVRSKCSILSSEGRVFPVDIEYAAEPGYVDKRPVWEQAAEAFSHYVGSGGEGDVLVFMPGGYEILQTIEAIRHTSESKGFILLPLHGELSPKDQDAAVARYGQRKVVVSTNVAETSLTIDGIRLVIDSGLARIPRYDPYRGINTLLIEKISHRPPTSARAGRAAPRRAFACGFGRGRNMDIGWFRNCRKSSGSIWLKWCSRSRPPASRICGNSAGSNRRMNEAWSTRRNCCWIWGR